MSPGVRKLALTAHIVSSVGWLGAVAGFLSLALAGPMSPDAQRVRAASLGMESMGWLAIVPLSLASLLTGLVQSLGTPRGLRLQLVADAGSALLVLLVATVLSVYTPEGVTRYGWRKQQAERMAPQS